MPPSLNPTNPSFPIHFHLTLPSFRCFLLWKGAAGGGGGRRAVCGALLMTSRLYVAVRRDGPADWLPVSQRHFKAGEEPTIVEEWAEHIIVLHTSKKTVL